MRSIIFDAHFWPDMWKQCNLRKMRNQPFVEACFLENLANVLTKLSAEHLETLLYDFEKYPYIQSTQPEFMTWKYSSINITSDGQHAEMLWRYEEKNNQIHIKCMIW